MTSYYWKEWTDSTNKYIRSKKLALTEPQDFLQEQNISSKTVSPSNDGDTTHILAVKFPAIASNEKNKILPPLLFFPLKYTMHMKY